MSVISKPTQRNIDVLKEEIDRQIDKQMGEAIERHFISAGKQMGEALERHFRSKHGPTGDLEGLLIVDESNIMSFPEYVSMVESGNWAGGLTGKQEGNWKIGT